MSSTHSITGRTTVLIAGEPRLLAFDMNAAAAFSESLGKDWRQWVVARFIGTPQPESKGMQVEEMTPRDVVLALHALLATDREDTARVETIKTLSRELSPAQQMDMQLAMLKCVLPGFGVPGEVIEAATGAAEQPRSATAAGTGTKHLRSRSGQPGFRQKRSGA